MTSLHLRESGRLTDPARWPGDVTWSFSDQTPHRSAGYPHPAEPLSRTCPDVFHVTAGLGIVTDIPTCPSVDVSPSPLFMGLIAALIPNPARLFRLRSAIRGRHAVESCASWNDVLRLCETRPVHVAIVDLFADGTLALDPVRQLKRSYPRMATVAYVDVTADRGRDLFDAGRSGVDALIVANLDDDAVTIAATIERAEARGVAGVLRTMLEELRPTARDALLLAVTRAHEHLTPDDLARRLSLSRRVLAKHLEQASLPSPQRLITWARLLVAAHLLEDPERSADNIALALHFPSGSAFRNTCQRYLSATPSEVRKNGGASWVLTRMQVDDSRDDADSASDAA